MRISSLVKAVGGAALGYMLVEPWMLRVRRYTVVLPGLPPQARGMRIVQISDIHAGAITPRILEQRVIALCAAEKPDLIALTGDFVSRRNSYIRQSGARSYAKPADVYASGLAEDLRQLSAPLGIYAVPGNHDSYEHSFDFMEEILAGAGIQALTNRVVQLENGLWLGGLDDRRAGYPRVDALDVIPRQAAQVILTHNPRLGWLLGDRNALVLSGHTHGGQIRLPGYTHSPVDMTGNEWLVGFYRLNMAQLYVSPGAGSIFVPMRLGARPEIAVFTLTDTNCANEP